MSASGTPPFLLVDGNNVIHAWPDLLALHRRRRGLAHEELCRRLRRLRDGSDYRVVVVFDGRGERTEQIREPGGLQIVYTEGGNTADDVIERLAARYSKRYRIAVATDDGAEQNLVAAMGAEVWSSRRLGDEIERASQQWRDHLG